jgi:3-oxo-5alpha-steroid 4-dehydrogenase
MDRISAWRFINPPLSFAQGLLVGPSGGRVCSEELYGAVIGEKMALEHGGRCWLVIDRRLWWRAHRQLGPGRANWFQSVPALVNLYVNIRRGRTAAALAKRIGVDPDGMERTLEAYNAIARDGTADPLGKSRELIEPLEGTLFAIDCSLGSWLFTCAALTLGGLKVDEDTGRVKDATERPIQGLYAAGRSAVGITSRGYVSGLSIADALFSGRRAGQDAARRRADPTSQ